MNNGKERVKLSKVIQKMNLVNLTPQIDVSGIWLNLPDVNRPALQLTGFYDQFDNDRLQIIGNVEHAYLASLSEQERYERYMQLLSSNIPCIIFCRSIKPEPKIIELAVKYQIPLLMTDQATSSFTAEVIRWLKVQLAPCIVIHGVLVDVYGVGVLITGESGIGKSEAALELIKRGLIQTSCGPGYPGSAPTGFWNARSVLPQAAERTTRTRHISADFSLL